MTEEQVTIQQQPTPDQLLALAVDKNLDIDKLKELMVMHKEWKADLARTAFFNALADFQSECPELRKSRKVAFKTKDGGNTEYNYAPLADIIRQIKPVVKSAGITYRWEIQDTPETITVTCLVTHIEGHTEKTTMSAKPDDSGKKNHIQARGSAIEYMKRYTLIGALGISTADSDVDGEQPLVSIDLLHKQYMEHYNQLITIDPKFTKWHPDNWQVPPTQKNYATAIHEIRKKIAELTPPEA